MSGVSAVSARVKAVNWKKKRDGVKRRLRRAKSSVKSKLQDVRAQAERIPQAYTPFISGRYSRGASANGVLQVADGGYCPSVDRIFDHCLVLRFVQADRAVKITHVMSHQDASSLPPTVAQFCFPDSNAIGRAKSPHARFPTENFTFTLTESDGTRVFGFTRRFSPNVLGLPAAQKFAANSAPVCICILSRHSFFGFFEQILEYLQVRWLVSPRAFFPFAEEFVNATVPKANQLFHINLSATPIATDSGMKRKASRSSSRSSLSSTSAGGTLEIFTFQREVFTTGATVNLEPLFDKLSVDNVLVVAAAMLCERRILLLSSSLGVTSPCIHALSALIFPFTWQHIFIPLLPSNLASYVCAPMPFLIGAQMCDLPDIERMPIDEVLYVYLDKNELTYNEGGSPLLRLPREVAGSLRRAVRSCMSKGKVANSGGIYEAFMAAFVVLFGNWRRLQANAEGARMPAHGDKEPSMSYSKSHSRMSNSSDEGTNADGSGSRSGAGSRSGGGGSASDQQSSTPRDTEVFLAEVRKSQLFREFLDERTTAAREHTKSLFDDCANNAEIRASFGACLRTIRQRRPHDNVTEVVKAINSKTMELTSSKDGKNDLDSVMQQVSQATYDSRTCDTVCRVLWQRLTTCHTARLWLHGYKALKVVGYLVEHGSDRCMSRVFENYWRVRKMVDYEHHNPNVQSQVRIRADSLVSLLTSLASLRKCRASLYSVLGDPKKFAYTPMSAISPGATGTVGTADLLLLSSPSSLRGGAGASPQPSLSRSRRQVISPASASRSRNGGSPASLSEFFSIDAGDVEDAWQCGACKAENSAKRTRCEKCDGEKPKSKSASGDSREYRKRMLRVVDNFSEIHATMKPPAAGTGTVAAPRAQHQRRLSGRAVTVSHDDDDEEESDSDADSGSETADDDVDSDASSSSNTSVSQFEDALEYPIDVSVTAIFANSSAAAAAPSGAATHLGRDARNATRQHKATSPHSISSYVSTPATSSAVTSDASTPTSLVDEVFGLSDPSPSSTSGGGRRGSRSGSARKPMRKALDSGGSRADSVRSREKAKKAPTSQKASASPIDDPFPDPFDDMDRTSSSTSSSPWAAFEDGRPSTSSAKSKSSSSPTSPANPFDLLDFDMPASSPSTAAEPTLQPNSSRKLSNHARPSPSTTTQKPPAAHRAAASSRSNGSGSGFSGSASSSSAHQRGRPPLAPSRPTQKRRSEDDFADFAAFEDFSPSKSSSASKRPLNSKPSSKEKERSKRSNTPSGRDVVANRMPRSSHASSPSSSREGSVQLPINPFEEFEREVGGEVRKSAASTKARSTKQRNTPPPLSSTGSRTSSSSRRQKAQVVQKEKTPDPFSDDFFADFPMRDASKGSTSKAPVSREGSRRFSRSNSKYTVTQSQQTPFASLSESPRSSSSPFDAFDDANFAPPDPVKLSSSSSSSSRSHSNHSHTRNGPAAQAMRKPRNKQNRAALGRVASTRSQNGASSPAPIAGALSPTTNLLTSILPTGRLSTGGRVQNRAAAVDAWAESSSSSSSSAASATPRWTNPAKATTRGGGGGMDARVFSPAPHGGGGGGSVRAMVHTRSPISPNAHYDAHLQAGASTRSPFDEVDDFLPGLSPQPHVQAQAQAQANTHFSVRGQHSASTHEAAHRKARRRPTKADSARSNDPFAGLSGF